MQYLSLPLEVARNGGIATTTPEEAVACLIEASARTPMGTCAWFPSFGILDLLEKQIQSAPGASKPHLMREAIARLNETLEVACAGSMCKVLSIAPRSSGDNGSGIFDVKIAWNSGDIATISLGERG